MTEELKKQIHFTLRQDLSYLKRRLENKMNEDDREDVLEALQITRESLSAFSNVCGFGDLAL